jgi:predicted Zn-dependent protease
MKLLTLLLLVSCNYRAEVLTPELPAPAPIIEEELQIASIKLTPKSSLSWVADLTKVAACVLTNKDFIKEVSAIEKFDLSTATGKEVAAAYSKGGSYVISTYKTKSPWSKVIATTYKSDPTTLYLNLRLNPRRMEAMVNTIVHEVGHLKGFSHGDNSSVGKGKTVNYWVGDIAEKYVKLCN